MAAWPGSVSRGLAAVVVISATRKRVCGVMRNLMIFAAILVGLCTFMAQMADKMSPAAASGPVPRKVSCETEAPTAGRTWTIALFSRGDFQPELSSDGQRVAFM